MSMIAAFALVATLGSNQLLQPDSCKVTVPNGIVAGSPEWQEDSYGNALLSTFGLSWPDETIVFKPRGPGFVTRDGALGMKFPWVKAVSGQLTVTGRRLDGVGGPPRLRAPCCYGDIGCQASYLIFPAPGCWEVTAQVGDREDSQLTFINKVVKIGDGPAWRLDPSR